MASKAYDSNELKEIRKCWNEFPVEVIPENARKVFMDRKRAVDLYIEGFSNCEIESQTGVKGGKIAGWVSRCCQMKDDGTYYGYEGLLDSKRSLSPDNRNARFTNLLHNYPELKEFIIGNYYGDKKYTLERNMNLTTLHKKFLKECARIGIQLHEYPFNTENKGYKSLCEFVVNVRLADLERQARRESKDNRQKLLSTGYGKRYSQDPIAPFSCVQVDGHIIDMSYTVEIMKDDGTVDRKEATRAWVFAVIDVATRCILGYSVSQEMNYNQYDVIDAVYDAITPRKKMKLSIPDNKYPENGGYPSLAFSELKYPLFDSIMLDNAKSHLSEHTINKIRDELLIDMNYGSVATPETRGIIERFFGTLETKGFHKFPMTTGSNIKDLKRRDPGKAAIKYHITFDQIVEVLEILIAEYNNTPHSAFYGLSPLECMRKKMFEAGLMPAMANDQMREKLERLRLRVDTRKVAGKAKNGKRPYINFMGAEYRGPVLSVNGSFAGQKIKILYDPRDISTVEAYTADGNFIDTLTARGELGLKSHSLKTRKMAMALARERGSDKSDFGTPITALENDLMEKASTSRRAATRSDIIRQEQGKPTISDEIAAKKSDEKIVGFPKKDSGRVLPTKEELDKCETEEQRYKLLYGEKLHG